MRASPGSAPDFAIFDTEAGVSTTERRLPKKHPFEDSQKYWTLYILGAGFSVLGGPNEALLPSPAQSHRPEKLPASAACVRLPFFGLFTRGEISHIWIWSAA